MSEATPETPAPAEFDLVSAMQGFSYPTETVTIYLDLKSLGELSALEDESDALMNSEEDKARAGVIREKQKELAARIRDTALKLELVGLPRAIVNAIMRHIEAIEKDPKLRDDKQNRAILLRSIARITNAAGAQAKVTEEQLDILLDKMQPDVYLKLLQSMTKVSFQSLRHEDLVTDPNFL